MDAAVEPEPAERIVYMRRIAGKKGAALAERCRHPLMDFVEIAMNDRISAALWKEFLKSPLDGFATESPIVGLLQASGKQYALQTATIGAGDLEQAAPFVRIREIVA